jgi:transposase
MVNRQPLTFSEKKQVYEAKLKGKTLSEIATMIPCSISCSRKWWRVGQDKGLEGLKQSRHGRHPSGRLSQFAPIVSEKALELKQSHPSHRKPEGCMKSGR